MRRRCGKATTASGAPGSEADQLRSFGYQLGLASPGAIRAHRTMRSPEARPGQCTQSRRLDARPLRLVDWVRGLRVRTAPPTRRGRARVRVPPYCGTPCMQPSPSDRPSNGGRTAAATAPGFAIGVRKHCKGLVRAGRNSVQSARRLLATAILRPTYGRAPVRDELAPPILPPDRGHAHLPSQTCRHHGNRRVGTLLPAQDA